MQSIKTKSLTEPSRRTYSYYYKLYDSRNELFRYVKSYEDIAKGIIAPESTKKIAESVDNSAKRL